MTTNTNDMHPLRYCGVAKELVAQFYGLDVRDLEGDGRTPNLCTARHVAAMLVRDSAPSITLKMIGRSLHRRYDTVLRGIRHVRAMIEREPDLAAQVETLRTRFANELQQPSIALRLVRTLQPFQRIND